MWSDKETTQDLLGFRVHSDLIYNMVTKSDLLPITVGVFADWGGGKSSILQMLKERIDEEANQERYCLYVNGWLFEGYDDAKSALIASILSQLVEHPTLGKRLKDKIIPFLKSVDYMRFIKMGLHSSALATAMAGAGIEATPVLSVLGAFLPDSTVKEAAEEDKNEIISIRDFRDRFSALLKESKIESLVILIDDLDRCSPGRIIENLEAIKLFLNVEHTAFVVGADPRLVRHAIRLHYRGMAGGANVQIADERQVVNDYLEKLIHVPFNLPRLSVPEVQSYMTMLFCKHMLNDTSFGKCFAALLEHSSEDRYSPIATERILQNIHSSDDVDRDELKNTLSFCETAAPLIGDCLKGNPRLVKRFLNTYVTREELAKVANLQIEKDVLVKLMVLEYGQNEDHRKLYDYVKQADGYPSELKELEVFASSKTPQATDAKKWGQQDRFLNKWAQMPPLLAEVDLRDYYWLSRDRMDSTIGGLNLISPSIKRFITDLTSPDGALQATTATEVLSLSESDQNLIVQELHNIIVASPDKKDAYIGLVECIEAGLVCAEISLASALTQADKSKMTMAAGLRLLTLKKRSNLQSGLIAAIEVIAEGDSPIGKVFQQEARKARER